MGFTFAHNNINVMDLEQSLAFYKDCLLYTSLHINIIVQIQRQSQAIEARTNICTGSWNSDFDQSSSPALSSSF